MFRLQRIFKNYAETGSFNEQVNLYGFVDSHVFLTKTGDLGVVLEVRGVDYECLDGNTLDGLTKRLESALKLFDENYRIYQYLFNRNNERIPYKLYDRPVVDTAIKNRLTYFAGKADTLFSLSIYYVILFEGFRYTRTLGRALLEFLIHPTKALSELQAHFSVRKQVFLLDSPISTSSCTWGKPKCAPHLSKRRWTNVSRSHGPDEFLDLRDTSAEAIRDPRQSDRPEPSREQGQGSGPQEDGRLTPNWAPEPTQARAAEPREIFEVRRKTYRLRSSEIQILSELGKFRAVATKDLQEFAYRGDKDRARGDVQNLIRQGLIAEKKIPHSETSPRRLLTLSKQGHQFLTVAKRVRKNQAIHYGFTKPREAHHDADLCRMYYTAAEKIERQGGRNLRVILDYELKKRVYHDLAKLGPHRESTAKKKEIAERHGLQLVRGKIPLPDLRIEYETREGEMARVDLELATEHYRGRNLAEKVRAGFSIYAHAQDAAGLRRVLDQRELTAEILSL